MEILSFIGEFLVQLLVEVIGQFLYAIIEAIPGEILSRWGERSDRD
ncbi:MAG: hypothetical protein KGS49_03010 [Planctomycetes bacterium]|jgi:hypothetical protein|nr:hypothetical protein [Planctomycetota bacterium]